MKTAFVSLFILLTSLNGSAQTGDNFILPNAWTSEFTISLSYSGSMDGSETKIIFTHDSCTYIRNSGMNAPKKNKYLLSESDRVSILKKLHALKVDGIHSESSHAIVNDGWSSSICFGLHCVSDGTSSILTDHDKNIYSLAYHYLEEFANRKGKR